MSSRRPGVIFVGCFPKSEEAQQGIGGIQYASKSLLECPLSERVTWHIVNNLINTNPPPSLFVRGLLAAKRLAIFIYLLMSRQNSSILILSPYLLFSLLEKGIMVFVGKLVGKHVAISLRTEIKPFKHDRWFLWFKRLIIHRADVIICQSHTAAQNLIKITGCDPGKIIVIFNWIDASPYLAVTSKSPSEPLNFIFVSRIETYKGIFELLEAVRLLKQQELPFHLVCCGEGTQFEAAQEWISAWGMESEVEFRGWVHGTGLVEAMQQSDVFVLPTYSEGMPNAMVQAMAAGKAVISTPVGGIPDLIEEGKNGVLVKTHDAVDLARSMRDFVANPNLVRQMGEINRQRIIQEHTIEVAWPRVARALGLDI